MAGEVEARGRLASADLLAQPADLLAGLATGPQRLHASGPGLPGSSSATRAPEITRIYLPPDANCLLSVADHCLRSEDYVNVIVSDKQPHLAYLDMDAAVRPLHQGHRHLGLGQHGRRRRAGRGRRQRRRHHDAGSARRGRDSARALPGPQDPLCECRRSLSPAARLRSIRMGSPTATSTRCSPRTSR